MKIAVSARGATPLTTVDDSFGRAYWFLVYDLGTGQWDAISNSDNRVREEGAGGWAAQMLVELGVSAVITGQCGPRVLRTLRDAEVKIYRGSGMLVAEAVEFWKEKQLLTVDAAHCQGNPYCLLACNRHRVRREEKVRLGIIY